MGDGDVNGDGDGNGEAGDGAPVGATGVPPVAVAVGDAAVWLWKNGIKPPIDGIAAMYKMVWNDVIKPLFNLWMAGMRLVRI